MPDSRLFLQTARLRLREFTLEDVNHVVALDSDPEVMRYISYGEPTPRATIAEKVLPAWIQYYRGDPRVGFWAAEAEGEFIGWFHLRPDRFAPEQQELGYRLHRRHWGRGYATEGSLALLDDGFRVSQFENITARTLRENVASQRVMQKCGMAFEEHFVYPESILRGGTAKQRQAVKYAATREQWLLSHPGSASDS